MAQSHHLSILLSHKQACLWGLEQVPGQKRSKDTCKPDSVRGEDDQGVWPLTLISSDNRAKGILLHW